MNDKELIHPLGEEGIFEFPTYDGKVFLRPVDDCLTPYGGLVPWSAFQKKSQVLEKLVANCPVIRSSPHAAPVYDILCSFMLTVLCDGSRFSHVGRLREDPSITELFGMKKVVSDDTIRRFLYSLDERRARDWIAHGSGHIWSALPERSILDWDSTVQTKFGNQSGAEIGYNPHYRGRKSYHPLLAMVGSTRLCLYYRWRPGKSGTAAQWREAMEECFEWLGPQRKRVWLNRGDIGFGNEEIMSWHEEQPERPQYLFKLKMTNNVKRAISAVKDEQWQGIPTPNLLQSAELQLQLQGWSRPRRVIVTRKLLRIVPASVSNSFWDRPEYELAAYVTSLPQETANCWQIIELYNSRGDCENVIDELKRFWGFNGFCCKDSAPTAVAARLAVLTYNLWNLFMRLMKVEKHVEAFQSRRWFLMIAARLVKHGRQKEMQIAVRGQWWQELKSAYQRVCEWLEITAPQLNPWDMAQPELLRI